MARLMILVAIVGLVYLLVRSFRGAAHARKEPRITEDMVRCEHCGVHLPKSEAILSGGHFFCGAEHRDEFLR